MTDGKPVKYTDGVEFILDLIDDYLDVKEAVEWAEEVNSNDRSQNVL